MKREKICKRSPKVFPSLPPLFFLVGKNWKNHKFPDLRQQAFMALFEYSHKCKRLFDASLSTAKHKTLLCLGVRGFSQTRPCILKILYCLMLIRVCSFVNAAACNCFFVWNTCGFCRSCYTTVVKLCGFWKLIFIRIKSMSDLFYCFDWSCFIACVYWALMISQKYVTIFQICFIY